MIVWCAIPSSEPTTKSKSSRGITSKQSGRPGAARASLTSSLPPWRPTNPWITNRSSTSASWQEVRHHEKYRGGIVTSSSSSSSKRSKSVSLSDANSNEVASQLVAASLGSPDACPSSSQHRPQGRKKATATATRRRAPAPAPTPFVRHQPPTNSLWTLLAQLADRSRMTPDQLDSHVAMIRGLRRTLGIED